MSEYTHNKAHAFIKCHQTIRMIISKRFHDSRAILLIAARTNTNSCQAWIFVNCTNVAPAHSSIQYRQIFGIILIEGAHNYPHVWKFPLNILKYLYGGGGTFEKCKLFIETHCISSQTARAIGILYRIKDLLPKRTLLLLYNTLILPYINYCNIAWGNCSKTKLDNVPLQKKAVRICTHSTFLAHTDPLFHQLNILKIHEINDLQTAIFMFKYVKGVLPPICLIETSLLTTETYTLTLRVLVILTFT